MSLFSSVSIRSEPLAFSSRRLSLLLGLLLLQTERKLSRENGQLTVDIWRQRGPKLLPDRGCCLVVKSGCVGGEGLGRRGSLLGQPRLQTDVKLAKLTQIHYKLLAC